MPRWDEHQLTGLVQHLGKEIARQPSAREKLAALERVDSPGAVREFVEGLDAEVLRLEPPAREALVGFVTDAAHWEDRLRVLKHSAERAIEERFSPSS